MEVMWIKIDSLGYVIYPLIDIWNCTPLGIMRLLNKNKCEVYVAIFIKRNRVYGARKHVCIATSMEYL